MSDDIVALVARIRGLSPRGSRVMVAVAGAPGTGKSTLAAGLVAALGPEAIAVPMDGFHLDNVLLEARSLLPRKGAPETFDAAGFVHAMRRVASEPLVILPAFDRTLDIAVAGRIEIKPDHRIVVAEGNYLCCTALPWRALLDLWDMTVFLDVPEPTLESRLIDRWRDHGLPPDAAEARARSNDMVNVRFVRDHLAPPDVTISQSG